MNDRPAGAWMLIALNLKYLTLPMYEGTVPEHVIAKRRAASKTARKSRRRNRVRMAR